MWILNAILNFIGDTALIWVPILLGVVFFHTYMNYRKHKYIDEKIKYVMLEINIPKDVFKSPQAMEIVINVLHHLGGGAMDWRQRFWNGAVLHPSSLEIVSIEGSIYFFIRTTDRLAGLVQSTIYSQYPNAEVNQVDDYTKYVPDYNYHEDSWSLYGADFKLANDDFYPIKTYVDYELDKNVGSLDEEQKIDPITTLIEFLGTAKVVEDEPYQPVRLTHGQQEEIKAIERCISNNGFETIIRTIYLAQKDKENPSVKGFFKSIAFAAFNSWNAIRKNNDTTWDWVWEDITGLREPALKRRFFNDYVERAGFDEPASKYLNFLWYKRSQPMILNSEELATLFHIPGRVSETGSLERIDAKKSQAPTNLPF